MRTRELLALRNTGHPGINARFAKAHSADWDFENDVDWSVPVAPDDPATEQFFLESFAMSIFDGLRRDATHPLLRRILELITRDESRHMGFGVLYVAEWMRRQPIDRRIAFAREWLWQILASLMDRPGPIMLARVVRRLRDAGVADAEALAPRLLREQEEINAAEQASAASGAKVPHLLKSARRAGLLEPEILDAVGLASHPLIRGALRGAVEPQPHG